MAKRHRIECITKPNRESRVEHITQIGGTAGGGWTMDTPQAIRRIDNGELAFFVRVSQNEVDVQTVHPSGHRPYIKTEPDQTKVDNLLRLDECPTTYNSIG
jgi:Protein of unknown function (DUF3892)